MKILNEKERLQIATVLAEVAHSTQKDKVGEAYINHLKRVSLNCTSLSAKIVGLLCDICEDKHMTHAQLRLMGVFSGYELNAIRRLDKGLDLSDYGSFEELCSVVNGTPKDQRYLDAIKHHPLAREVKIAGLRDNSDTGRFFRNGLSLTEEDQLRFQKYERQLAYLLAD